LEYCLDQKFVALLLNQSAWANDKESVGRDPIALASGRDVQIWVWRNIQWHAIRDAVNPGTFYFELLGVMIAHRVTHRDEVIEAVLGEPCFTGTSNFLPSAVCWKSNKGLVMEGENTA
jgi:hypothetical protein